LSWHLATEGKSKLYYIERVIFMDNVPASYTFQPIGRIYSCYTEKFGIPKQPGLVTAATAELLLYPPYNREEMFRGLDEFSHIWILFLFHQTIDEGWKPTVRPPRLGGQKRVGVFASRSPHRPNHIGMSVVKLEQLLIKQGVVRLFVSGVDLLDNTPVIDIKPYVPYSDSLEDAGCGYTREVIPEVKALFLQEAQKFCDDYAKRTGRDLKELVIQTLRYDPRPASQRTLGREYGMLFWDVNVRWRVAAEGFEVLSCEVVTEK
jgi:tRNA-Thr(GGU) m(6)t(6)A37 methyltransferase TsaA